MRSAGKPAGFPTPRFAPPPRLAITADELAAVRSSPDFGKIRAAAVAAADPLVDKPIPLPDGPGSWIFYYANPENGNPLTPLSPLEHKDPKTGQVFNDARTVAAYRGIMHSTLEAATVTLGWAYAYTGDEKYAAASLRIFRKLADDYATYPRRLDRWGRTGLFAPLGGRRMVQSLDEAFGMTRLAKGYDLVRNSATFTAADRRHVEEDFFRPTADTLLWFNQDINNHQTWYDAGLMCIASVLADERLVDRVLTMRGGFFDQLERAVGADGLWYEGTNAYHSYALQALIQQVDAGRRLGLPMHDHPRLKAMFTAPIHAAYPNGQVPAINDSDRADISMFNAAWEWAWKTYRDPVFAQAIAKGDQRKLDALMGAGAATARWPIALESEALMDAGLAVLRMGAGATATCVFLDFGPHGGGHGHLDKLSLLLYANGREWLLDPGRLSYSHKEYKTWVKTTAAHNTVAIGSRSQAPATGRLVYLQQADGHAAAVAECNAAYPATMLRRHVLLTPTFCVDRRAGAARPARGGGSGPRQRRRLPAPRGGRSADDRGGLGMGLHRRPAAAPRPARRQCRRGRAGLHLQGHRLRRGAGDADARAAKDREADPFRRRLRPLRGRHGRHRGGGRPGRPANRNGRHTRRSFCGRFRRAVGDGDAALNPAADSARKPSAAHRGHGRVGMRGPACAAAQASSMATCRKKSCSSTPMGLLKKQDSQASPPYSPARRPRSTSRTRSSTSGAARIESHPCQVNCSVIGVPRKPRKWT
jgi:hypothetical protein